MHLLGNGKKKTIHGEIKMKLFIINVGVNKSDEQKRKIRSPIFKDNSFEFIPIKERKELASKLNYNGFKYSDLKCFNNSKNFISSYLPKKVKNYFIHNDPDFVNFTYGDKNSPRSSNLRNVKANDVLVFLARLYKYDNEKFIDKGKLYFIGFFKVTNNIIFDFNKVKNIDELFGEQKLSAKAIDRLKKNAHCIRSENEIKENFKILIGDEKDSHRFRKACEITPHIAELIFDGKYDKKNDYFISNKGEQEYVKNKNGKPTKYEYFHSNTRSIQCYLDDEVTSEKECINELNKIFKENNI